MFPSGFHQARAALPRRRPAAPLVLRALGWALAGLLAAGCQPAQSTSSDDTMLFGLFKTKSPSSVDASVGARLVREAAYPAGADTPAAPAWPQPRKMSLTALPPAGRLSAELDPKSPADAFVGRTTPGSVALVNVFEPRRSCQLWTLDSGDPARLATQVPLQFDANQAKWSAYSAQEVLALPGDRLLVLLRYRVPNPLDALYLVQLSGAVKSFGNARPDWAAGLPSRFLDNLQAGPDAVLVIYRSDSVRLGPERYVNRFDHVLLFSPRHLDGLEVARIGIDDGNVRRWRFAAGKLWLQTSDDRGAAPKAFNWSLDLSRVL